MHLPHPEWICKCSAPQPASAWEGLNRQQEGNRESRKTGGGNRITKSQHMGPQVSPATLAQTSCNGFNGQTGLWAAQTGFSSCAKEVLIYREKASPAVCLSHFVPKRCYLVLSYCWITLLHSAPHSPQKCSWSLQLSFTQASAQNKRTWDKSPAKVRWSLVIWCPHSLEIPFQGLSHPAHLFMHAEQRLAISAFHLFIFLGTGILKNCL